MCFSDGDSEPDIWLTRENGYYVPAPPMVYIPGQRQLYKQVARKARRGQVQPQNVSQPLNSQTAPSELLSMPISNQSPALSAVTGPRLHVTTFESERGSATEPQSSAMLSEKPAPKPAPKPATEPAGPSARKQPENVASANACVPDAVHRAESSASTASSLRSILKKTPSLRPEDSVSNVGAPQTGARDTSKHETENRKDGKSKKKKSVSFLGRDPPLQSLPMTGRPGEDRAAREGAAIARMLVEKEKALRAGRRSTAVGSDRKDGGTDLGSNSQSSRMRSVVSHGGETRNSGKGRGAGKQTGAWYDRSRTSTGPRPHMVQQLLSDDDQSSDVDDEVVGRWP